MPSRLFILLILLVIYSLAVAQAAISSLNNFDDGDFTSPAPARLEAKTLLGDSTIQSAPTTATILPAADETCDVRWEAAPYPGLSRMHNHDIAVGNGVLVAVGADGAIQTSTDQGLTWMRRVSGTTSNLKAVVWSDDGQFVAVGENGAMATSPDGSVWTTRDAMFLDSSPSLQDVIWSDGQLVAVGDNGTILTSPDGITWTYREINATDDLKKVTWGNGQFVVIGYNAGVTTMITSSDGVNWSRDLLRIVDDVEGRYDLYDITWGNGQFIAVGSEMIGSFHPYRVSVALASSDGFTWTHQEFDHPTQPVSIMWVNDQFVAAGQIPFVDYYASILTSPDGVTWTPLNTNLSSSTSLHGITWTGHQWLAIGHERGVRGSILASPDLVSWLNLETQVLESIASNGYQWVAVGHNGALITSPDGVTWTAGHSGHLNHLYEVIWNGNLFLAVGAGQSALTSPDGVNWTLRSLDANYFLKSVAWSRDQFVAVGEYYEPSRSEWNGVVLTSPDSITWTHRDIGVVGRLQGVAWNGRLFVAVGLNTILSSADGVTWNAPDQGGGGNNYHDIIWGGDQFLAVGSRFGVIHYPGFYIPDQTILTGPDGVNWTSQGYWGEAGYYSVAWGANQFVIVGSDAWIARTSPDGVSWTSHQGNINPILHDIAWDGRQFVAVGDGVILRGHCSGGIDPITPLITHYYQAILGRAPEPAGLAFWEGEVARVRALGIDVPEAFRVMAGQFFTSAEYLDRNPGDAGYVADLYATFFAREPDGGGLSYWTGQLAAGLPRSVVLFHFLFSEEFTATMRNLFGETAGRAESAAVVDFYRGFLNRLPDAAGFAYWLDRFRSAQCHGAAAVTAEVERISAQFLASAEYAGRRRDPRDFVADLYYAFLRRGGEAAGFQYWVDRLAEGSLTRDGARRAFVQTPEFQNRVARIIDAGCVDESGYATGAWEREMRYLRVFGRALVSVGSKAPKPPRKFVGWGDLASPNSWPAPASNVGVPSSPQPTRWISGQAPASH